MKQSRKELILNLHSISGSSWKIEIEKEFPKLFTESKLEVGKWYKENCSDRLVCYTGEHQSDTSIMVGYGFGCEGWVDRKSTTYGSRENFTPATDKEVEEALIKEAKKRGFKEGVRFDCARTTRTNCLQQTTKWEYNPYNGNTLSCKRTQFIYSEGKWATIIDQPKKLTVEEVEKKLGYKVEIIS